METSQIVRDRETNKKVEGKTRLIKQFLWLPKLIGTDRRWFSTEYILQKCKSFPPPIGSAMTVCELDWEDQEWASIQRTFVYCDCGNELTHSNSFISDDKRGVHYKCINCGTESWWDFDNYGPVVVPLDKPREVEKELTH